jgi:hypothetical protein
LFDLEINSLVSHQHFILKAAYKFAACI